MKSFTFEYFVNTDLLQYQQLNPFTRNRTHTLKLSLNFMYFKYFNILIINLLLYTNYFPTTAEQLFSSVTPAAATFHSHTYSKNQHDTVHINMSYSHRP